MIPSKPLHVLLWVCVCVCVSPSLLLALGIIFCFRSMTLWQFLFLFGLLNGEHTQLHNETTNNSYLSSCCTAVLYSAVMCCVQTMICRSNEIYCVCARCAVLKNTVILLPSLFFVFLSLSLYVCVRAYNVISGFCLAIGSFFFMVLTFCSKSCSCSTISSLRQAFANYFKSIDLCKKKQKRDANTVIVECSIF